MVVYMVLFLWELYMKEAVRSAKLRQNVKWNSSPSNSVSSKFRFTTAFHRTNQFFHATNSDFGKVTVTVGIVVNSYLIQLIFQ